MSRTDYYTTLGVNKSAPQDEIKKAYRKLAHLYHPDKKGGDEKKFKEVNEAYQVLSDSKKRAQYDQFGSAGNPFGGGGGPFGGTQGGGFEDIFRNYQRGGQAGGHGGFEDIFDVFGNAFGFGRRRQGTNRGADIQVDLSVSLRDAARGNIKKIEISKDIPCQECLGSGVK